MDAKKTVGYRCRECSRAFFDQGAAAVCCMSDTHPKGICWMCRSCWGLFSTLAEANLCCTEQEKDMKASTGNTALAGDISVVLGEAFSEALVVAFTACDDLGDPLSLNQKRQMISSCISVVLHMRSQIECILDLDSIARECVEDPESLRKMFEGIQIDHEDLESDD